MSNVQWQVFQMWTRRQWLIALAVAVAAFFVIALPTAMIPNPVFGREIPPTWWSYPVLVVSSVLMGLLVATYVKTPDPEPLTSSDHDKPADRATRWGGVGGVLSFFAVGCPVCNKLILLALGSAGALQYFEPVQPVLAVASIAALVWALRVRLRTAESCEVPAQT